MAVMMIDSNFVVYDLSNGTGHRGCWGIINDPEKSLDLSVFRLETIEKWGKSRS